MSHWWRAYDEAVDDPKLQRLPPELFRTWFNICCITSANGGTLPDIDTVAFKLRMTPAKAARAIDDLRKAILIDDEGGTRPHNWNGRQFKSDVTDPTAAERMKRHRNKSRNATVTPAVTPPVTDGVTVTPPRDREQNTETERKEDDPADAGSSSNSEYAFESGIIRLSDKHFNQWKQAFSHLDLAAELIALTEWAGEQGPKRWFTAVANALAKKNRAAKLAAEKQQQQPFKWNGIEGVV